jgi:predicted GNAT family N-acyltransferase
MELVIKQVENEYELDRCLFIRKSVFVNEQGVPLDQEYDEWDNANTVIPHIIVYDGETPVATSRLRVVEGVAKLERICVMKDYRKYGVGKMLVDYMEQLAREQGLTQAKLNGQTQAASFYERLGYVQSSEVFLESNIPHVLFTKSL